MVKLKVGTYIRVKIDPIAIPSLSPYLGVIVDVEPKEAYFDYRVKILDCYLGTSIIYVFEKEVTDDLTPAERLQAVVYL